MNKLSKQHFWEWFKRHSQEYLQLKNKSQKEKRYWLNELNAHLRAYYKFFGFSIDWRKDKNAILTITANSKPIHFKKVDALVAKAPVIDNWTFHALERPRPIDFLLEQQIEESHIDPREFYFSFDDYDTLIIYHPLCSDENEHLLHELAYIAVYNLLGERSFGTDIVEIQVANLSLADSESIAALETLPGHIGMRKSGVVVDGEGRLVVA